MKAQNLTTADLKGLIFPSNMAGDIDKTYKWIEAGKQGRSRAAERVCSLFRKSEPPPAIDAASTDKAVAVANKAEETLSKTHPLTADTILPPPPAAIAPAADVTVSPDGTVTVRPSTLPPAASMKERAELQAAVGAALAPAPAAATGDLEAMAKELRKAHTDWKGGPYVCGNAYGRMKQVSDILAKYGF